MIAHLRKSTIGANSILNTHPFQHGKWVFAHNGNIKNFHKYTQKLKELISLNLVGYLLGETDSEIIFFIILSELERANSITGQKLSREVIENSVRKSLQAIIEITGKHVDKDSADSSETFLSFILTDGHNMVAYNGGKTIYYSTHKKSCPDKNSCHFYDHSCENLPQNKDGSTKVNHLILASEPTSRTNIWQKLEPGEFVGVDEELNFFKSAFKGFTER